MGAACSLLGAAAARADAEGDGVSIELLPLLLDHAASYAATADRAHECALSALMLLPRAAAAALALRSARSPSQGSQQGVAARRRRAEVILLALSRQPRRNGATADSRGDAVIRKCAPAVAQELEALLADANATCRQLARHAYLALIERSPRFVSHRVAFLPHRIQLALRHTAAARSRPLGPPLLPPLPPPPPSSQAVLIQAHARGRQTRRWAARLARFVRDLASGERLRVCGAAGGVSWPRVGCASALASDFGWHLATLLWRGEASLGPGEWFGVSLDAPAGRHDGAVSGRRYFECEARHGLLVRASCICPLDGWPVSSGDASSPLVAAARAGHTPLLLPRTAKCDPTSPALRAEPLWLGAPQSLTAPMPCTPIALTFTRGAEAMPGGPGHFESTPSVSDIENGCVSIVGSHSAALQTMRTLLEDQLAAVRAYESASRPAVWGIPMRGPECRGVDSTAAEDDRLIQYTKKMEVLCAQQRLVAAQLHDSLKELLARQKDDVAT